MRHRQPPRQRPHLLIQIKRRRARGRQHRDPLSYAANGYAAAAQRMIAAGMLALTPRTQGIIISHNRES